MKNERREQVQSIERREIIYHRWLFVVCVCCCFFNLLFLGAEDMSHLLSEQ